MAKTDWEETMELILAEHAVQKFGDTGVECMICEGFAPLWPHERGPAICPDCKAALKSIVEAKRKEADI